MAKQKITTQRNKNSVEKEYARNQRNFGKGFLKDVTVDFAYSQFAVYQLTKGNSKQTIAFYDRLYLFSTPQKFVEIHNGDSKIVL